MFSRACLALAVLLLATGCQPAEEAPTFAESRTPPDLAARFFPPEGWAWGQVQVGSNPPQRYGVGSTWRAPRAIIVVLPDTGECAEAWFETAGDLIRRSYTVWVLDRAAECGSGRISAPRDKVHVKSFDPDVAAVKALLRVVIRPKGDVPVIVLGQGQGALMALRAAETGLAIDGLILSSPANQTPKPWRAWSRETPDAYQSGRTHDPWRGRVTQSWMIANPDLRGAGPSSEWLEQAAAFRKKVRADAKRLSTATLILTAGPATEDDLDLCGWIGACAIAPIMGAKDALSLEADTWRTPWLEAVVRFIAGKADAARRVGKDREEPGLPLVPNPVTDDMRPREAPPREAGP